MLIATKSSFLQLGRDVVPHSVDDGQVVKIVQVGDNAVVGTRTASSTASSMLSCGKTNESKANEFSMNQHVIMSFELELATHAS